MSNRAPVWVGGSGFLVRWGAKTIFELNARGKSLVPQLILANWCGAKDSGVAALFIAIIQANKITKYGLRFF